MGIINMIYRYFRGMPAVALFYTKRFESSTHQLKLIERPAEASVTYQIGAAPAG
jgi:hypothetical protein